MQDLFADYINVISYVLKELTEHLEQKEEENKSIQERLAGLEMDNRKLLTEFEVNKYKIFLNMLRFYYQAIYM